MMKKLSCRAMGMNCVFVARDESEEEVVRKIGDHLKTEHSIPFSEELKAKAVNLVRFDDVA